jgi:hypothetical protein
VAESCQTGRSLEHSGLSGSPNFFALQDHCETVERNQTGILIVPTFDAENHPHLLVATTGHEAPVLALNLEIAAVANGHELLDGAREGGDFFAVIAAARAHDLEMDQSILMASPSEGGPLLS